MELPTIHEWVDRLSPAQRDRLRIVANQDEALPPIGEDNTDVTESAAFSAWVQAEVAPAIERIVAGDEHGYSGDEVLEWLAARRAQVA
jgi:hypothetical protein